jgi:two-component system sensor histidine kinase PilS (NtrC family)
MTTSADVALRRRLVWLISCRAVLVPVLLAPGMLAQSRSGSVTLWDPFVMIVGLTYVLTALYVVTLRFAARHRWLIDLQFAGDALLISGLVVGTGGIASDFSSLYVLPIIGAATLQFRRGGLMVALLSAVLFTGIVLGQYTGSALILGWLRVTEPAAPIHVAAYPLSLNVFGFIGVALLTGYLAEGLRHADARLQRASSQIANLQAFNQHVIDSLTSGLATTDTQGCLLTFNRTAETITGYTASGVVGRAATDILKLPQEFEAALEAGFATSRAHRVQYKYETAAGARIELGLSAAPLLMPGGRAGFLFSFQDVTDVKKLEREAQIQQRLAAVGEMAAGIAHEIRNPLASMSGSIQILRQELPLTSEQAQLMDIVLRESERLNDTIRSFLAYARPQRAGMKRLDVRRIIRDTALLLRNSPECAEGHDIDVRTPDQEVWYEADEAQIRQIVWNLATNGLRAMPSGGRLALTADVETPSGAGEAGRVVRISVQDQGVGIPSDELDSVFQPFRGAFTKGSGLGLSIVHRIVSDYGGEIQITSQHGAGTTVSIRLPALQPLTMA